MPGQADLERAFRAGLWSGRVPDDVTAPAPAEIAARFAVYRNNVRAGLVTALRRRFPVVERLVGAQFAQAMFGEFARAHPPPRR